MKASFFFLEVTAFLKGVSEHFVTIVFGLQHVQEDIECFLYTVYYTVL